MTRHLTGALLHVLAVALTAWLGATGCGPADEATFEATFAAEVECVDQQFPFEPTIFAASATYGGVLLRMQLENRARTRADAFFISVTGPDTRADVACPAADELAGQTIEVGPEACAQAYFRFNQSCARSFANLHVTGTVTFEELGLDRGDRISGVVSGTLIDVMISEQTGVPVMTVHEIGAIEGQFDFEVAFGPPYQTYSTPPGPVARP